MIQCHDSKQQACRAFEGPVTSTWYVFSCHMGEGLTLLRLLWDYDSPGSASEGAQTNMRGGARGTPLPCSQVEHAWD